ncbi:c6 zinc finger domain-containing protein [Macrophomina phaseolina]|uniref:C6 zinc finger domain-containing protein n=1 Tax=Macrophomina phaseolina TaxID=35725 RepID=A0ABQ8GI67_9PEZI|nr:c6 zinc finger domain-containing protein [Macrophomina phaseolina]
MSLPPTGRVRLACDACTRKKIRCDKTVPCSNCTRRGLQDSCTRPGEGDGLARLPSGAVPSVEHGATLQSQQQSVVGLTALVTSLSTRLAELEKTVKEQNEQPHPGSASTLSQTSPHVPAGLPGFESAQTHDAATNLLPSAAALHDSKAADSEAASILEFLAWGRRKPAGQVAHAPDIPPRTGVREAEAAVDIGLFHTDSYASLLQTLLPNRQQIEHLLAYHEDCLLWYHGSFFPPVFRQQLDRFFNEHGGSIAHPEIDLQWIALLFSIMAGSMCCASRQQVTRWGFQDEEKASLSRQWHRAVITCLNAGDFMTKHQLVSCEAIATLTLAAHLLGRSNHHSVLLASAVRIAQSLGLHKLSDNAKGHSAERGRRVWCQLCTQDWFGIPFSETYSIHPLHTSTAKPMNCHEHDMLEQPVSSPTRASFPRYMYEIARLMPQLQDGIATTNTLFTKYEQVLKYDMRMRALATTHRPLFLSNTPVDPEWPRWVPWARRCLAISSAHKIIMIHRQFFGQSFTNPSFTVTRRTSVAAAKTILKEHKQADDPGLPHFWIFDAFSVTACSWLTNLCNTLADSNQIILCFDLLYSSDDSERAEHRQLVEEAVYHLRHVDGSTIAACGVRLVAALLSEADKSSAPSREDSRKRKASETSSADGAKRQRRFDMASFVRRFYDDFGQTPASSSEPNTPADGELVPQTPNSLQTQSQTAGGSPDGDLTYTERLLKEAQGRKRPPTGALGDFLSPRGNFENVSSFENLLYLAHTFDI